MKDKILFIASMLTISATTFLIVLLTVWAVYPYKLLVINKEPIEILTKEVGENKPLTYRISYCKYTKLAATVQKSYENSIVFPATTQIGSNDTGCRTVDVSQAIPYELPTGTYRLKIAFTYKPNPIREITIISFTEPFRVTERDF